MKTIYFPPMLMIVLGCYLMSCDAPVDASKPTQVEVQSSASFVDQKLCVACHQDAYHQWKGSHHDLAMAAVSEKTVLGDFNQSTFSAYGVTSTFYKRNHKFYVQTDGRDGKLKDFEVSYVFGVDPLQQYLIKFPDGRMQALDIAWDTRSKEAGGQRWFHLHPNEKIDAKHPFHWTKKFLNWNYMCAECHSTNLKKNFDLKSNTFHTTWSKVDVSCQACHGPGSQHVDWAKGGKVALGQGDKGLVVDLSAKSARVQVEACARCHARRSVVSNKYEYGKPLMDFYKPQLLREPFYYPDGQIKDEVYVYGSFAQSKMHARGVRCTDCHNAHTSRLRLKGDALCVSCHNTSSTKRFSGLKQKNYDSKSHHFHKPDSDGAKCVSCHMPATTYMGVDPRRDHSFRIPRPDLSVKLGTPNACMQCHKGKGNVWAKKVVEKWYPVSAKQREQKEHFSEVFAAAQTMGEKPQDLAVKLVKIMQDKEQPAIIRATAASLLEAFPRLDVVDALAGILTNAEPLIRYHAIHSLDVLIPRAAGESMLNRKLNMLVPLLHDAIRAVRTEAARALSNIPKQMFSSQQYTWFEQALAEYSERQASIADRPEAHSNMGLVYQRMGKLAEAEKSFHTAIRLESDDIPAHFSLANLYNKQGRNSEAEEVFHQIIAFDPNNGEAYYSLGLLLAEMGNDSASELVLSKAVQLLPKRPRVRYNYALSLKKVGKNQQALMSMRQVVNAGGEPMMIYILTTWLIEAKHYDEALLWAEKLVEMLPSDDEAKRLLNFLQSVEYIGGPKI